MLLQNKTFVWPESPRTYWIQPAFSWWERSSGLTVRTMEMNCSKWVKENLQGNRLKQSRRKTHTPPFKLTVRLTPTCTQGYGTTHQKAWTYMNAKRAVPPCLHVSVTNTLTVVYPIFTRVTTLLANIIDSPIVPACLREAILFYAYTACTSIFTRAYDILLTLLVPPSVHKTMTLHAYTACTSICTRDYDTSRFHCLYLHLYTRLWHFTLTLLVPPSVHKTLTLHAYTACTSICTRDPDTTRGYDTTCSRWLYLHVYMGLWHYKLTLVVPPSLAYPGCPSIFTWIYDTTSLPWLYLHLSMGLWHYTLTLAVSLSLHRTMTLHTYTGLYPIFSWGHATSRSYDTTCLHWLYLHLYTRIWHNTLRWLYLHYTKLRHYTLTWLYIHLYIRKCHYTLTLAVPPPVHLDMLLHTYTGCTSTRLWIRHYASNSRCTSIFTRGYAYRGWSIIKT